MASQRIRTEILVQAGIRYCGKLMVAAMLRRRGDADAGALLIKVCRLDGTSTLFARSQSLSGGMEWRRSMGDGWQADADVESRLEKEISYDPDIWIIEIEDREGRNPFADLAD